MLPTPQELLDIFLFGSPLAEIRQAKIVRFVVEFREVIGDRKVQVIDKRSPKNYDSQ
ncbi:MAG: hypothetical protein V7L31_12595 [Nostoc sp.]|uniref:hypothetical protein n=1 Tax=Nostoc sp. TaxID=1180 RepID=UPI002FF43000